MSIIIQINSSVERKLREKAVKHGVEINQFISQFLENTFGNESIPQPSISAREALLLQQVNLGISPEKWVLYLDLKDKRQKKTLSNLENNQLIELTEEVETANVRRISSLSELAQIRNIPIRTLMEQLGLAPNHE